MVHITFFPFRPLADEMWKELEELVLSSSQDFEGRIKIPSTFHDLLVKLDSSEVLKLIIDYKHITITVVISINPTEFTLSDMMIYYRQTHYQRFNHV